VKKIQPKSFFKNIASSLLSATVDITLFMVLVQVGIATFSATVLARLVSGVFNFSLNKIWVFEKKDSHNTGFESMKYLLLFVFQMMVSGFLTDTVSSVLTFSGGLLLSKMLVDCFLFVTNFIVQKFWIFPTSKKGTKRMKKKHTFAYFYSIVLIFFTIWSMLDTFVIADKITVVNASSANTSIYTELETASAASSSSENNAAVITSSNVTQSTQIATSTSTDTYDTVATETVSDLVEPIITDTSYQDANIQITIDIIRAYNTDIYVADVVVSDVAYLKTALAQNVYGKKVTETTSDMAAEHNAILAINGDYYGFRNAGFVLRNGVLYQTTARSGSSEALVVNADGSFEIVNEANSDAQVLYDAGALQIFTFGPGLIEDGQITVSSNSEVSQSMGSNPRTAIGMVDELHYIFLVSDGRTSQSAGLSLLELAQVMQSYGCTVAYNLDGGGSSTMVFNGQVINNPTSGRSIGERKVSDIIYIGGSL